MHMNDSANLLHVPPVRRQRVSRVCLSEIEMKACSGVVANVLLFPGNAKGAIEADVEAPLEIEEGQTNEPAGFTTARVLQVLAGRTVTPAKGIVGFKHPPIPRDHFRYCGALPLSPIPCRSAVSAGLL